MLIGVSAPPTLHIVSKRADFCWATFLVAFSLLQTESGFGVSRVKEKGAGKDFL